MAKTLADIYTGRGRGPWSLPSGPTLSGVLGTRERMVLNSRTCEAFPHRLNRDCEFYLADDCTTYYCPTNGQFTIKGNSQIVN